MLLLALGTTLALLVVLWMAVGLWLVHDGRRTLRMWDRLEWGYLPTPEEMNQFCAGSVNGLISVYERACFEAHAPIGLDEMLARVDRYLEQIEVLFGDWRLRLLRFGDEGVWTELADPPLLAAVPLRSHRLRWLALVERAWRRLDRYSSLHPRLVWEEWAQEWFASGAHPRNAAWHAHATVLGGAVRVARRAVSATRHLSPEDLPDRLAPLCEELRVLLRECRATHTVLWDCFIAWRTATSQAAART